MNADSPERRTRGCSRVRPLRPPEDILTPGWSGRGTGASRWAPWWVRRAPLSAKRSSTSGPRSKVSLGGEVVEVDRPGDPVGGLPLHPRHDVAVPMQRELR